MMPQIQADRGKVSIRLEQTYNIDPTRNEVAMTFKVFMENTDSLDRESFKEWEWEFGFPLNDIKVRDNAGDLKYDYNKKEVKVKVTFRNEVAYGQKYEYTIMGKTRLDGLRGNYCYKKFESLGIVYIVFQDHPTHLVVTFPKTNYVELPFKALIKENGNLVTAEMDVTYMEYTVLFVENGKFEKVTKKMKLQNKEYEVVAAGVDKSWAESAINVQTKLLPFLESEIGLPFPENIDRFIIYQVKEIEGGGCWWGFHWGTSVVTWEKTENGLYELLGHELSHHWFTGDTQWINEGNANLFQYFALNKFGYKDFADSNFESNKATAASLQDHPLSTASYDKFRQAVYAAGFMFMYDLHQKYGAGGLKKLYKLIIPEDVNSFEFYYYATKAFGEGVSGMFERRIFPKEDMPQINEFKKSYEEYLKTYNNITGLYEKNGVSTKTWRDKKDEIRKQVDKMDFDTATIKGEIDTAKNAEAALKKVEEFTAAMKEKGVTPSDEQTEALRKKIADRDFSTIDADIESLKTNLTPQTTTPPETKPPEATATPAPETPPQKTGFEVVAVMLFIAALSSRKKL
jgi:hypothetical protein